MWGISRQSMKQSIRICFNESLNGARQRRRVIDICYVVGMSGNLQRRRWDAPHEVQYIDLRDKQIGRWSSAMVGYQEERRRYGTSRQIEEIWLLAKYDLAICIVPKGRDFACEEYNMCLRGNWYQRSGYKSRSTIKWGHLGLLCCRKQLHKLFENFNRMLAS